MLNYNFFDRRNVRESTIPWSFIQDKVLRLQSILTHTMSASTLKTLKTKRGAIKTQCTCARNTLDMIDSLQDVILVKQRK